MKTRLCLLLFFFLTALAQAAPFSYQIFDNEADFQAAIGGTSTANYVLDPLTDGPGDDFIWNSEFHMIEPLWDGESWYSPLGRLDQLPTDYHDYVTIEAQPGGLISAIGFLVNTAVRNQGNGICGDFLHAGGLATGSCYNDLPHFEGFIGFIFSEPVSELRLHVDPFGPHRWNQQETLHFRGLQGLVSFGTPNPPASEIPEPATFYVAGGGLIAVLLMKARRNQP